MRKFLLLPAALVAFGALAATLAPASAIGTDGGALFRQRCASCHSTTPGGQAIIAPNLAGVVGRKAASTPFQYTPALKNSGLTWTKANLNTFLTGPMKMVPGTRMVVSVSDPAQRAAILDYLASTGK